MQNLLDEKKITKPRARIDRTELNSVLNLAYYFKMKDICNLRIKDVYDGSTILPSIQSRPTEDRLRTILMSHIEHLREKAPIDLNAPLFPGYFEKNGEKQLRRHIRDYTDYRDFNAVKKSLRADQYQQPQGGDPDSRVKKIAQSTGRSERSISRSLGIDPVWSGPTLRQGEKLKDDDPRQLLQILDAAVVMPEIQALDENGILETINKDFRIIESVFQGSAIMEMEYWLIEELDNRVSEIERELLEIRNRTPEPVKESKESISIIRQFLHDIIAKHNETMKPAQILDDEQQAAIPGSDKCNSDADQASGEEMKIPKPEVSDQIMTAKIDGLFLHIHRVRSMVSPEEWKSWENRQASLSEEKHDDVEEADYLEKKLHAQRNRPEREPFYRETKLERKKRQTKDYRQYINDNTPDLSVVIKYAVDLIQYTGIFCHEVTDICIRDVIKAEYQKRLEEAPQTDWIVDEIAPLPVTYPKGSNALSIQLSNKAKEVIRAEIEFLRGIGPPYFSFSIRKPLFPMTLSPPHFSRTTRDKGKEPRIRKSSPQQQRVNGFKRELKKIHVSDGYEHLRTNAIRLYCAELMKEGLPMQDAARLVQRFARYSKIQAANRIIDEIQK